MDLKRKCLIIVDMQKGLFTDSTPRYKSGEIIRNIDNISKKFRSVGFPVVYIQHNGLAENDFLPNTEEWEILDELKPHKMDFVIEKFVNDGFYKSKLKETLDKENIDHLVFTGCATDFCVNSTILSALSKEYKITVVSDGHTTADRPGISSKTVVDYYNWLWSNMISINTPIAIKTTNEVLSL